MKNNESKAGVVIIIITVIQLLCNYTAEPHILLVKSKM